MRRVAAYLSGLGPKSPFAGLVEVIDNSSVSGWVADRNHSHKRLTVLIVSAGEIIGETEASLLRDDLAAAGIGDGRHGFDFAFGRFIPDQSVQEITVLVAGTDFLVPIAKTARQSLAAPASPLRKLNRLLNFRSRDPTTVRVACTLMQKDEDLLLEPWLAYYGYLFGYENLFVFDNGSTSNACHAILARYERLGVNVNRDYGSRDDFIRKGEIVGELIKKMQVSGDYDVVLPLDCDEFICACADDGITFERSKINRAIAKIFARGVIARTTHSLTNRACHLDQFRLMEMGKSIVPLSTKFVAIDHGYHHARSADGVFEYTTDIIYVHLHFRPFHSMVQGARNKVTPFADVDDPTALLEYKNSRGPTTHVVKWLGNSAENYEKWTGGHPYPWIFIDDFSYILCHLTGGERFKSEWTARSFRGEEEIAPPLSYDLIDLKAGYHLNEYLSANPDIGRAGVDSLVHYCHFGYREGRPASSRPDAWQEVLSRLQKFRAEKPGEPVGFRGLVSASRSANEKAAAESILAAAVDRFPEDFWVAREYALSALASGSREIAIDRSTRFLDKFPNRPDAYQFVLAAFRQAGWSMEAKAVEVEMRRRNHRPNA